MSDLALTIISPMFNEEENVQKTVSHIFDEMKNFSASWELILVNDGSTDGTLTVARSLEEKHKNLHVVSYPENRGRGKALRTGFANARGEIVVTTDFDLSYSPDHIKRIYDTFAQRPGADVVLGSAYMKGGSTESVPFKRLLVSRLGNRVLSLVMGRGISTITCILRGYRREVLNSIELDSDGKEIHLEILSKVLSLGYSVVEIPAHLRGRTSGKSKFRMRSTSASHIAFSFFERPMLLFGGLGLMLLIAGMATGLFVVFLRYSGSLNPERPLMTLLVLLVLAGIQILTIGFLSIQVLALRKEIYKVQAQNRRLEEKFSDRDNGDKQ